GEAAAYIEQYFAQYPGIKDYMERAKAEAREHGYVTTLFGRRCHLPGIKSSNGAVRQFSERAAINAPLQGTAADIIKRAMIACARKLAPLKNDARMLLQVHDELVFEIHENAVETALPLIKQSMEGAASLSRPLTVETGVGQLWGAAP
ncbi:MAG: DNA polymerase I, partial [Rickettsiales bacterium]|nr:DNA polymerase I [Rickettsiales bacterium]